MWLRAVALKSIVQQGRPFGPEQLKKIKKLRAESNAKSDASILSCPECGGTMDRFQYPHTRIALDQCPTHGIWMDEGELERVELAAKRLREMAVSSERPADSWTCPNCDEMIAPHFQSCWNCLTDRATGVQLPPPILPHTSLNEALPPARSTSDTLGLSSSILGACLYFLRK